MPPAGSAKAIAADLPPAGERDLEVLAAQYERIYGSLHRQAVRMVKSTEAADDIVQEAFARTTATIREGAEIHQLAAWLRATVRHLALQHLQRRAVLPLKEEDSALLDTHSTEDILHARQRCKAVYKAVEELPVGQKSAFLMAELYGYDYQEIADNLGRTEHAIRQLLVRARSRVRAAVGPDVTSLNVPLAGIHFRGLIEPRGRAHAVGDYVAAKLANLQATVASLLQRSAEFVAQPAAPLVAGALVAGGLTLAVSGPQTQTPAAGGGAAPVAVAPESSPSAGSVSSGNERAAVRGVGARPAIAKPQAAPVVGAVGKPEPPSTGSGDRESRPDSTDTDKGPRPADTASAQPATVTTPGHTPRDDTLGDRVITDPSDTVPEPGGPGPGGDDPPTGGGGGDEMCIEIDCGGGGKGGTAADDGKLLTIGGTAQPGDGGASTPTVTAALAMTGS